ncbi:MAG: SMP-30/gluconolactonase/LRE family protein [Armatimonadetes bacterium]|nr:SMP-30/gluconolactonase/LRE family protein [Armatimonadota bacterium]
MQILRRSVLALAATGLVFTAALAHPGSGIAVDRHGNVYFLDTGSGLWKIDTRGRVTRLPGQSFHWLALDASDRFATARLPSGASGDIERSGARPTVLLSSDYPIEVGPDGNLYYAVPTRGDVLRMIRRTTSGGTSALATLPTKFSHINGIAAGPEGAIYYTDDKTVRRITAKGGVSTVAVIPRLVGAPLIPGNTAATGPYLRGLAVDARGTVYVAASGDGRVLKIAPGGKVTTVLRLQSPWSPTALALFGGDVYVLEYLHTARDVRRDWLPRVRKIASNGKTRIIATVAQMPGVRG